MSEYKLDIIGKVNLSDYSKIYDYIGIVDVNDKFTITLNNDSVETSELIYNMLEKNDFSIYSKGGDENGKISIAASRNKR